MCKRLKKSYMLSIVECPLMKKASVSTVFQKTRHIRHYFIEWKNKGSSGAVTRTKQLPRPCEKTRPLQTLACKNKLPATASFFSRFSSSL